VNQTAHLLGGGHVIDEEQQVDPRQPVAQPAGDEPAGRVEIVGRQVGPQQMGHVAQRLGRGLPGGERQEIAAVSKVAGAGAQQLPRQACFADAAQAGDEHRPAGQNQPLQVGQFRLAPGEGGQVVGAEVDALRDGAHLRRPAAFGGDGEAQRRAGRAPEFGFLGRRQADGIGQGAQHGQLGHARLRLAIAPAGQRAPVNF